MAKQSALTKDEQVKQLSIFQEKWLRPCPFKPGDIVVLCETEIGADTDVVYRVVAAPRDVDIASNNLIQWMRGYTQLPFSSRNLDFSVARVCNGTIAISAAESWRFELYTGQPT